MKKLLLLGGSRFLLPVINAAHELGLYVITCDYLPDNIAHKYSDEYINASVINKNEILAVAESLKIDGIMSFACDPGVTTAAYVAEQLGLPCCGPYESVCILQDKAKFRKFLTENGFNVPKAKGYSSIKEALTDVDFYKWPVIVKPTDSAGSKGVSRVETPDDLEKSIKNALNFSHSGTFIIEEFVEKKGCSSDTDSFSVNGKLKFVSFSSQMFDTDTANPYTPAAYSWPSTFSGDSAAVLQSELQRLLSLLKMRTTIYNIETREGMDGKVYIMEVSPRGGGNRLAEMLQFATGVNLIKYAVKAAVGMDVSDLEQRDYNGCWAEYILHSDKSGIFDSLSVDSDLDKNIVEKDLWVKRGDRIREFTGANETIGTLVLKFDNQEEMSLCMKEIKSKIDIVLS